MARPIAAITRVSVSKASSPQPVSARVEATWAEIVENQVVRKSVASARPSRAGADSSTTCPSEVNSSAASVAAATASGSTSVPSGDAVASPIRSGAGSSRTASA